MPRRMNKTLELGLASLEAKKRMDLQRIHLPTHPDVDQPELPADPTNLTDSALMSLFTQTTAWSEYLGSQLAAAEVDERYAEAAVEKAKVILGIDLRTKLGRAEAQDEASNYWTLLDTYQEKHAYRKLIAVMHSNMEGRSTLLSRELTRRVARTARDGRVERYDR